MSNLSRRKFLLTTGAAAAGTVILNSLGESATQAKPTTSGKPEVTTAKLGFIALTDAAPLIIAKEKGFFAKYGMTGVEVEKQASWPVTRDNLE